MPEAGKPPITQETEPTSQIDQPLNAPMSDRAEKVDLRARRWYDRSEALKMVGGLLAVGVGLFTLLVIAILAIVYTNDATQVATIASSSFGVIGTIVGAYFGVKIGTDQTQRAMNQNQETMQALLDQSARAEVYAAYLTPEAAGPALDEADRRTGKRGP
jgi:hypothetical protein